MKKLALLIIVAAALIAVMVNVFARGAKEMTPLKEKSIYDFVMKDIDGKDVKMDQYRGKALLLVNVASECGFTPQYEGLQKVYQKYKDRDFLVLGFPANDFGGQEPGSNAEIKNFCSTRFKVTFPMFAKITVTGDDKHPFYRFLTEKATDPEFAGDLNWNFNKFLVDKNGKIVARFGSGDKPEDEKVTAAIEQTLK